MCCVLCWFCCTCRVLCIVCSMMSVVYGMMCGCIDALLYCCDGALLYPFIVDMCVMSHVSSVLCNMSSMTSYVSWLKGYASNTWMPGYLKPHT